MSIAINKLCLRKAGKSALALFAVAGIATFALPANAAQDQFNEEQTEAIGEIVRDYLVTNPEVIIEAMEAYQQNRAEIEARQFEENLSGHSEKLFNNPDAPFEGNPDGNITVVEFFDYNCGYCKKALTDVVTLLGEDKNVKVVFLEMPILSEASREAARWALAADKQGKYYDYHVALMSHSGPKNAASFEKIGKDLGLDIEQLRKDAKDPAIQAAIDENLAIAQSLGIRGTPAFVIGDTLAPGYLGTEGLKAAVAQARADKE